MPDGGFGRRDRFLHATALIDAAEDAAALARGVRALLAPYGLRSATFVAFGQPARPAPDDVIFSTYAPEWLERYRTRRYRDIDPVLRVAAEGLVPVDWSRLDWSSAERRRFRGEAEEAGVGRQGLALPSRGPGNASALLTVTSDAGEGDWRGLRVDLVRDMAVIVSHLHARALSLRDDRAGTPVQRLSARERETLQWAAAGKTHRTDGHDPGPVDQRGPRLSRRGAAQAELPDQAPGGRGGDPGRADRRLNGHSWAGPPWAGTPWPGPRDPARRAAAKAFRGRGRPGCRARSRQFCRVAAMAQPTPWCRHQRPVGWAAGLRSATGLAFGSRRVSAPA